MSDNIAAARAQLAETEALVHAVLADPGYVTDTDSPAVSAFISDGPGLLLRMAAAHHELLNRLEAAKARETTTQLNYQDWLDGSRNEQPLPEGPSKDKIPGLELAARILHREPAAPEPAVQQWLDKLGHDWQHGHTDTPALPSHLRALVAEVWLDHVAVIEIEVRGDTPRTGRPTRVQPKVTFHARLYNGTQLDSGPHDSPEHMFTPTGAPDAP